jgi:hypothetical protein
VPCPGINRFHLTTKSSGVTGIDKQGPGSGFEVGGDFPGRQHSFRIFEAPEFTAGYFLRAAFERQALRLPGLQTAVQDGDPPVTEPAKQPPRAGSNCPACRVIANDAGVGIDTQPGKRCFCSFDRG